MELDYVKLKLIKPALSGYIRDAQILLKKPDINEKVVHDVRVLMKKSRSALKLVMPQLDREYFENVIFSLREVGRIMCTWREASVHRRTLKELKKENPALFFRLIENETITNLLKKTDATAGPDPEIISGMEQIGTLLHKAAYRVRFEQMNNINPQTLIKELELTYNNVVNTYLKCRNNSNPENVHEFRKKSKDFLYQIYFFRPLNPAVIKALEKKVDVLTQNLGKVNDLSQLIRALGYKYHENANLPEMDELILKIRQKQDKYFSKIWPTAYKVFCPGQVLVNILGFRLLVI